MPDRIRIIPHEAVPFAQHNPGVVRTRIRGFQMPDILTRFPTTGKPIHTGLDTETVNFETHGAGLFEFTLHTRNAKHTTCRIPLLAERTSLRTLSIPQEFEPALYRRGRAFQGGGDHVLRPIHSRHFQKPALFLFSPWPPQLYHASSR
jgi:hypothetical protein